MRIVDHNEVDRIAWDEYVLNHKNGSFFHTRLLFEVYEETQNHDPFALFVLEDDRIVAMLSGFVQTVRNGLLSQLSKRSVLLHSPIGNSAECLATLLNAYNNFMRNRVIYTEIRNHYEMPLEEKCLHRFGFEYIPHLNILIDLTKSEEELFKNMSAPRRREVRKGLRENLAFKVLSLKDVGSFYSIVKEIYSRANLPLVTRDYFEHIVKKIDLASIFGVYKEELLLGGVLVISYKGIVYSLYGGSSSKYFNLRPNDYLFWQTIIWAKNAGNHTFDWLGAGHPEKPYGVRDWKKQFGGHFVSYGRHKIVHSKIKFKLAEAGFKMLRKMKISV